MNLNLTTPMIMALLHTFPHSAATQAVTAAESSATSAAAAEQHGYGITYDSAEETISITAPTAEESE